MILTWVKPGCLQVEFLLLSARHIEVELLAGVDAKACTLLVRIALRRV